jgi:DNA-binding CsgD family transcriptional regulator
MMDEGMDRIIGKIYDTTLDESCWSSLLGDIAQAVGAVSGVYAGLDTRRGRGAYWHALHHNPQVQALYNEVFLLADPTLAHTIEHPGVAFACTDYITDEVVATNPFYTQFLIPGGMRYVLSGVVSKRGSIVSFFGFQRTIGQQPFGAAEKAFMQQLIPHFQKADEIATRTASISEGKRAAMAFMDRLEYGVVFVDRIGQICMSNKKAEAWLSSGAVVLANLGRLGMRDEALNKKLFELVRQAGKKGDDLLVQGGGFEVPALGSEEGARIVVLPLEQGARAAVEDTQATAVVVVVGLEQRRSLAPQVLRETYGLTAAEQRVALEFAAGMPLLEVADKLSLSAHTVKTHIKRIFEKTRVNRQSELVRLVYEIPALV